MLIQTAQYMNIEIPVIANTTLNEKFGVRAGPTDHAASKQLASQYICIGNGGHTLGFGADPDVPIPKALKHYGTDAALYKHLPFVLRSVTNDLTDLERAPYRLRSTTFKAGYVAYFLKKLDLSSVQPSVTKRTDASGTITSVNYAYQQANLFPTPPNITPGDVVAGTKEWIAATAKVRFSMSAWEINELGAAADIIYGSRDYAIISELGLCSAADQPYTEIINGVSTTIIEAVDVKVVSFIPYFNATQYSSGVDLTFDLGASEPISPVL
jgi:hypothetical protein